jgi:DNA-binding transcriptional ArsR family regulator
MRDMEKMTAVFKALSDPTRLKLVWLMGEHKGALCVNALAHNLEISQSAVSQHLRVLKQAGLVRGDRRGYYVHYTLDEKAMEEYRGAIMGLLGRD